MGLTRTGFAIYGLLEQARPTVFEDGAKYAEANRDLASLIEEAVQPITDLVDWWQKLVDWWQKEDLQREMRSQVKRRLRAVGLSEKQVEKLAGEIVELAKVREQR